MKARHTPALFGFLLAILLLLLPSVTLAQAAEFDPAFCLPGIADLAQAYPGSWEEQVDPSIQPLVEWQRIVYPHALVVGWADEAANEGYTPRVVIHVGYGDGTDLFALGLPREYNGKPVVIEEVAEIPSAASTAASSISDCPGAPDSDSTPPDTLPVVGAGSLPIHIVGLALTLGAALYLYGGRRLLMRD